MQINTRNMWDIVKELLHKHDCVIVPGFGGFVCNREPSRIDQVSHLITPPAKRVVFNQNLKTNDGLLAGSMAASLKIPYNEALAIIDSTVAQIRDALQDKKQHTIEYFGVFRLNADANYVFLPDKYNNYLTSSYGLVPLQAQTVGSRTIKAPGARIFKDRKEVKEVKARRRRLPRTAIIVALLAAMLSVNSYIFLKDHRISELQVLLTPFEGWFDSPDTRPAASQPTATILHHKPAEESIASASTLDLEAFSQHIGEAAHGSPFVPATPVEPEVILQQEPVAQIEIPQESELSAFARHFGTVTHYSPFSSSLPVTVNTSETVEPGRVLLETGIGFKDSTFYVIGGVFCKERNARRYFHELETKGFKPVIVENSTIHCNRVSYGRFTSRVEANRVLSTIQSSENANAWLLCLTK